MTEIITDIDKLRRKCYDVIPGDIDGIVAEMVRVMAALFFVCGIGYGVLSQTSHKDEKEIGETEEG